MGNLICIFCNLLVRQLYCNQRECFNKNLFLKISQYSPENTCVVSLFFYKVISLQPSGLQHRCFLVNNTKFLRTPILKNICEPLTFAFFKLILWSSFKSILKTKWQKLINKYENTFIWTLPYERKSLKCVIKPVLQTYLFRNVLL